MSLRTDLNEISENPKEFRKFGLLIGGLLLAAGIWKIYQHHASGGWFLFFGVALILLGGTIPRSIKWLYRAWMTFGITMGWIVSNIILVLIFFLLVTPLAVFARLSKKDFLAHKLEPNSPSYWIERKKTSKEQLERQF